MVERNGILITLGVSDTTPNHSSVRDSKYYQEEAASHQPFLKIWDLQTSEKKTGAPILLRSVKVQSGNRPHPVSTTIIILS